MIYLGLSYCLPQTLTTQMLYFATISVKHKEGEIELYYIFVHFSNTSVLQRLHEMEE